MGSLAVNVDAVSSIMRTHNAQEPDPVQAAVLAELAGADAVVATLGGGTNCHGLKSVVKTKFILRVPLSEPVVQIARQLEPDLAIIVPSEENVDHFDLSLAKDDLLPVLESFEETETEVALELPPLADDIKMAGRLGVGTILFDTEEYVSAAEQTLMETEYDRLLDSSLLATKLGLKVHMGGRLNRATLSFLTDLEEVHFFHVGYALVARGLLLGFQSAVEETANIVQSLGPAHS